MYSVYLTLITSIVCVTVSTAISSSISLLSSNAPPLQWQFKPIPASPSTKGPLVFLQDNLFVALSEDSTGFSTWFYNSTSKVWILPLDKQLPSTECSASGGVKMVQLSQSDGSALLFGGQECTNLQGYTFTFDLVHGWQKMSSKNQPPRRVSHALSYVSDGTVLLFGGQALSANKVLLDDTWIYNTDHGWTQHPLTNHPSARQLPAMTSLSKSKVLIFGGSSTGSSSGVLSDSWIFDNNKLTWEFLNIYTSVPITARWAHSMTVLNAGRAIMFGGVDVDGKILGDTLIFSQTQDGTPTWEVKCGGPHHPCGPIPRENQGMATNQEGNVIMYGGRASRGSYLSDTWYFDIDNSKWTELDVISSLPAARARHSMATLPGLGNNKEKDSVVILFGGDNIPNDISLRKMYQGTWIYTSSTGWTATGDGLRSPEPRISSSMAALGNTVILFGGQNQRDMKLATVWTFDQKTLAWTESENDITPSRRVEHSMITLASCKQNLLTLSDHSCIIVFGGINAYEKYLHDAWTLVQTEGDDWIELIPISSHDKSIHIPSPRAAHAMASLNTNRGILFGGYSESGVLGDTWIMKVENKNIIWRQIVKECHPKSNDPSQNKNIPEPRMYHSMSTLGPGRVILYGGMRSNHEQLSDTWILYRLMQPMNETFNQLPSYEWSRIEHNGISPLASMHHRMTSTLMSSSVVLFGGLVETYSDNIFHLALDQGLWQFGDGCPRGFTANPTFNGTAGGTAGGTTGGCAECPLGTFKNTTTLSACYPCNNEHLTTAQTASPSQRFCSTCKFNSHINFGSCYVANNSAVWKCSSGSYGPSCTLQCPGGITNVCNGNGLCDSGIKGTGKCTCQFAYYLGGVACSFPTLGILIPIMFILFILGIVGLIRLNKNHNRVVHLHQASQMLLNNQREEHEYKQMIYENERLAITDPLTKSERDILSNHIATLQRTSNVNVGHREKDKDTDLESGNRSSKNKFTSSSRELVTGVVEEAAAGLRKFLNIDDVRMQRIQKNPVGEIEREVAEAQVAGSSDIELQKLLHYVMKEVASEKQCTNGLRDAGRGPVRLQHFLSHRNAKDANLKPEHVIALRLYTTNAFWRINNPLRDRLRLQKGEVHPLAATVLFIDQGIKLLRIVSKDMVREAKEQQSGPLLTKTLTLWRGMQNVHFNPRFQQEGGTEMAPMSTTSQLRIAIDYGACAEGSVLFKIRVPDIMAIGADLKWLSAFPNDAEVLYPPLTLLRPTGRTKMYEFHGRSFQVMEVQPDLSSNA